MTNTDQLREALAAIEHERWADWQLWCHKVLRENITSCPQMEVVLARWDKQAITPYDKLSDREKASDMEQVDRYWHLIEQHTATAVRAARIDERQMVVPNAYQVHIDGDKKYYFYDLAKHKQRLDALNKEGSDK